MLFNSISFIIFLPVVFAIYWTVGRKSVKYQNIILLLASYFFYSFWDWRFLFLLAFSTLLDYFSGLQIFKSRGFQRKLWLIISVGVNLGFLGFFKYYNFFIESFSALLNSAGLQSNATTLNIILPVGISFYTFHGLSYVFDIYYKKVLPTKNFVQYSLFVSFFPLLVAGPIERATHLLPQVKKKRIFNSTQVVDGMRQFLWGLVKKVVIADNCAEYANQIFNNSDSYSGMTLFFGAVLFAFQIYGDFSGYTDMALGTARFFGLELLKNFNYPYFSRSIAEFWRRWHISLSSWFKDYIYIPLGGSRVSTLKKVRNTFIIFLISGFWHGANWTFIFWGAINAIFILPDVLFKSKKPQTSIVAQGKMFPSAVELLQLSTTFFITVIAWIFFRAESISHAFSYISNMFSLKGFNPFDDPKLRNSRVTVLLIIAFVLIEWAGRENKYAIANIAIEKPRIWRWSFYAVIIFIIGMYMNTGGGEFIYFQF